NLLAEYSDHAGIALRPHMEATLTMAGCSPLVRIGMARRISSAGAKKLTSMICRRISSVEFAKYAQLAMPALLIRTSRPLHGACTKWPSQTRGAFIVQRPETREIGTRLLQIIDGTSMTFAIGEAAGGTP